METNVGSPVIAPSLLLGEDFVLSHTGRNAGGPMGILNSENIAGNSGKPR